jgi:hypothetical protein
LCASIDHVADGVEPRDRGLEALVDPDVALRVECHAERVEPQADGDGTTADRHEHAVERFGPRCSTGFDCHLHRGVLDDGLARLRGEPEREALLLERGLERAREVAVHARHDAVRDLDHPNLGAQARPDRA